MVTKGHISVLALALILLCLTVSSCSKGTDAGKESGAGRPVTQQTKDAIHDYGKSAVDKARAAQAMGEDRIKAVDEALESTNKQ